MQEETSHFQSVGDVKSTLEPSNFPFSIQAWLDLQLTDQYFAKAPCHTLHGRALSSKQSLNINSRQRSINAWTCIAWLQLYPLYPAVKLCWHTIHFCVFLDFFSLIFVKFDTYNVNVRFTLISGFPPYPIVEHS